MTLAEIVSEPAAEPATNKIEIRDLAISFFKGRNAVHVLSGVNLEIATGEFVCVLGPSGCGKSTLLNVIAGFLEPSAGEVRVDGEPVRGPNRRRIFVFQERGLFPWLTVGENIGFGLAHLAREKRTATILRYVKLVGLDGFEHTYPRELSGGMKQRVEVARALAVEPDVLYMDEPFGALDSLTRLTLRSELLRIWEAERKTVVFVTHDVDEALQLADRIVVLSARPAEVRRVIDVQLPRPRVSKSVHYGELQRELLAEVLSSHTV